MHNNVTRVENIDSYWKLLYDGECPLCTRFAAELARFDVKNEIFIISLQKYIENESAFSYDTLMKDVHLLGKHGEILIGSDAVYQILMLVPQTKPYRWMIQGRRGKTISRAVYSTLKIIRGCATCRQRNKFSN